MRKDKAKEFYKQAEQYCHFIKENVVTVDLVPFLIELLMTLYISAMDFPETQLETDNSLLDNAETDSVRLSDQISATYWEVFNPYIDENPVCSDLIDDLTDIAIDLKKGMKEYESGRYGNAIFEWKLLFNNHWGQHIVDALRALHTLRAQ